MNAVTKEQLAAVLFTALASASLLASAFGNLYSVYARFITEGAPGRRSIWHVSGRAGTELGLVVFT
jgi:hypothetical protein